MKKEISRAVALLAAALVVTLTASAVVSLVRAHQRDAHELLLLREADRSARVLLDELDAWDKTDSDAAQSYWAASYSADSLRKSNH